MILSASRRTDIPCFYSRWFLNRIREGFVLVRNPMNIHQVSRISLLPEVVDGIVFWTKNPAPMLDQLSLLDAYPYYFQFTLNSYGQDIESNVPSKSGVIIPLFQKLSDLIGPDRIIWRYDPILLNEKYTIAYHIDFFEKLAKRLSGYTKRCTISFLDMYKRISVNMEKLGAREPSLEEMQILCKAISEIASVYGLQIDTCAEREEHDALGIHHARCIDPLIFEKMLGCRLCLEKDKNQRQECGCVASIDIGTYNTCQNGCLYCYANHSQKLVLANSERHNPESPLLFGEIEQDDLIKERVVKPCRNFQQKLLEC